MSASLDQLVPGAFAGRKHTPAARAKMKAIAKAKPEHAERLRRMAAERVGKPLSPETRERISAAKKGKTVNYNMFTQAAETIGVEAKVMVALHADLALLAKQYGISLHTLQKVAGSRMLHRREIIGAPCTVAPPKPAPAPMPPRAMRSVEARLSDELYRIRCIACGEVFQQTPKCRIKCEPCSGRRYA